MMVLLLVIYLAFISLGLPDSLLGSAWPIMHQELGVALGYAGIVSALISMGTITSSLLSDRLTYRFGAGRVTAVSVGMTAVLLLGFSLCRNFVVLCLMAFPYGLGAGGVDAALNNYVAVHYKSSHMSWLHCMWGLGASVGPYFMAFALNNGAGWRSGYRYIGFIQIVLTFVMFMSLGLWKRREGGVSGEGSVPLSFGEILGIKGAKEIFVCFFCYCAIETTAALWASSYLNVYKGIEASRAAGFAALFYIGITVGRGFNGFLALRFSDRFLIRLGCGVILCGIGVMVLPGYDLFSLMGIVMIGLGCAPIYPCIIHSTPVLFTPEKSQAIVGVEMACAYLGSLSVPPLFGLIDRIAILPYFLLVILVLMFVMHELVNRKSVKQDE